MAIILPDEHHPHFVDLKVLVSFDTDSSMHKYVLSFVPPQIWPFPSIPFFEDNSLVSLQHIPVVSCSAPVLVYSSLVVVVLLFPLRIALQLVLQSISFWYFAYAAYRVPFLFAAFSFSFEGAPMSFYENSAMTRISMLL